MNVYLCSCLLTDAFLADDFGQRALVGKVCMDRNDCVKHYKETLQDSQDETCW